MITAIIFDFGGVFMKTVDHSPRHRWDNRLGFAHGSVEQIVHGSESWRAAQTGQLSPEDYRNHVKVQLGLDPSQLEQLFTDYFSGDQLDQELVSYARNLHKRGYQIALLSNDSVELRSKLEQLEIADLFDPLVISAEIGMMKPNVRAYQIVLEQLGCPPTEAIFIDDMPANIAGAEAIGLRGILYQGTTILRPTLEALLVNG